MVKQITKSLLIVSLSAPVAGVSLGVTSTPAAAQVQMSQCNTIQDRRRRQNCREGVAQGQSYAQEAEGWRREEADIRRRHEQACRAVGMIARFTGSGRALRAACVAPRVITDMRR